MNIAKIKDAVCNLDWNCSCDKQKEAINFLSGIDQKYYFLIFDKSKKETWENAVKTIGKIGFPKNIYFISDLIWLLQDINWPGAYEAISILLNIDASLVIPELEKAIINADKTNDIMWLGGINIFIQEANYSIDMFSDKNILNILENADF